MSTQTLERTTAVVLHDFMTIPEVANAIEPRHFDVLADVDAGMVRSVRSNRGSAVKRHADDGSACVVSDVVWELKAGALVQRVQTDWYLTPAGALILKRWGGAR